MPGGIHEGNLRSFICFSSSIGRRASRGEKTRDLNAKEKKTTATTTRAPTFSAACRHQSGIGVHRRSECDLIPLTP
eukprot:scaffold3673_cov393-Prasinococcus_capsulatus_cf.AAC.4